MEKVRIRRRARETIGEDGGHFTTWLVEKDIKKENRGMGHCKGH
jgi:hypothetical protein